MKSQNAKKTVAIYSIVFGGLGLLGTLNDFDAVASTLTIIIELLILGLGIILLLIKSKTAEKTIMIISLVFYSLFMLIGVVVLFAIPFLGPLFFGIIFATTGVPFIFSIVYLVRVNKEETIYQTVSVNESLSNIGAPSVREQLIQLKKLFDDGLLTSEEYEEKRKDIIETL